MLFTDFGGLACESGILIEKLCGSNGVAREMS